MNAGNTKTNTVPVGSTTAVLLNSIPSAAEKSKQWQRELLMERIRSRATQHKSFQELAKAMRMSMLEKRYALDAVEKANLQKCLDSMQHCIKVTSRQGLVERLESLSRQLGLKFMEDTSGLFISTDMFYLEIILDANGALTDVKVHHECKIEQQSCSELVNCLNRGDFADFTVQLEGLSSIYQLNAEPKVKTKAFVALQAMETDLYNLFQMQNFNKDNQHLVKESAVGLVLKRRGGHPMKLTYFVSPYDLISVETSTLQPLSTELITSKDIGFSVTVNLEASSANKLQILPTVSAGKDPQTGADVPVYAPLTQMNSMLLPATFVLRLNKPLPVCYATLRALGVSTDGSGIDAQSQKLPIVSTIMNLIVQTASEQQLKNSQKGLFVCLPDQTHCYFFTENKQMQASLVSSVPFTEPSQVPKILEFLKKQALFYTLLSSCVRTQSKMGNDMDSTTILEVNAISFHQISVSLQHPYEESMATVEFDLRDGNVKCTIYSLSQNYDQLSLKLTKIVEKCLSIPVTIRALLKFWDQESLKMFQRNISAGGNNSGGANTTSSGGFGNFSLVMGPNDSGGSGGGGGGGRVGVSIKMEPNTRQQMPNIGSTSTAGTSVGSGGVGVAGFLKFKNELKKEDFHESPKSQTQMSAVVQSVEMSSLGHCQQQQQQQQSLHMQQQKPDQQQQQTAKVSDIEIADKYKNIWKDKTPNLKNCVSITPVSHDNKSVQQNLDVKRSGGIEIIPLTAQGANGGNGASGSGVGGIKTGSGSATSSQSSTSSAITITPINAASGSKEKKVSSGAGSNSATAGSGNTTSSGKRTLDSVSSSVSSELQKEKKRKKRRDDSPMGPPEKVYSRQNSPAANSDAAATAVARKFSSPSSSPKGGSGGLLASGSANSAALSTRPSPKHSPVYSSPKHNTASNSPKSPFGTHSPKHGSSGKPSMSTLKSAAATSLSPKGEKGSSTGSNSSSGMSGVPALSAAAAAGVAAANAVKSSMGVTSMQQLKSLNHLTTAAVNATGSFGSNSNVGGLDLNAAAAMRKVVSSAVSLMGSSMAAAPATTALTDTPPTVQQQQQLPQQQLPPQQQSVGSSESNASTAQTSSEYMVKSSQEGLKLTINKTSNKANNANTKPKQSSSNSSSSSTVSARKQHTGLKPGVNSGPASKKLPAILSAFNSSNSATSPTKSSTSANATKHMFQKSNSSGNLSAKLSSVTTATGSSSSGIAGNSGGGAVALTKSASTNSFGDLSALRKCNKKSSERDRTTAGGNLSSSASSASQPATRMDHHVDMMTILQYASPTMAANMEGFMKGLNSKFHIPKLSQRGSNALSAATTTATPTTTTHIQSTSAPTTPTGLTPPAPLQNVCSSGGDNSGSSIVVTATATTATATTVPSAKSALSTYGQQHFANDAHGNMLPQHLKQSSAKSATILSTPQNANTAAAQQRSPPPPYHAAVAAAASATAVNNTLPNNTGTSQPSVSVHILKSPVPSPLMSSAAVNHHNTHIQQQQQQHHQQQAMDFLAKATSTTTPTRDEAFITAAGLAGK